MRVSDNDLVKITFLSFQLSLSLALVSGDSDAIFVGSCPSLCASETPPALDSAWSIEMRFRPLNTVLSIE